jgi:hypothetical protein
LQASEIDALRLMKPTLMMLQSKRGDFTKSVNGDAVC